jgi:nucleoid DNA-binding protein
MSKPKKARPYAGNSALLERMQMEAGISVRRARPIVHALTIVIREFLNEGRDVNVLGLGKFFFTHYKAQQTRIHDISRMELRDLYRPEAWILRFKPSPSVIKRRRQPPLETTVKTQSSTEYRQRKAKQHAQRKQQNRPAADLPPAHPDQRIPEAGPGGV